MQFISLISIYKTFQEERSASQAVMHEYIGAYRTGAVEASTVATVFMSFERQFEAQLPQTQLNKLHWYMDLEKHAGNIHWSANTQKPPQLKWITLVIMKQCKILLGNSGTYGLVDIIHQAHPVASLDTDEKRKGGTWEMCHNYSIRIPTLRILAMGFGFSPWDLILNR